MVYLILVSTNKLLVSKPIINAYKNHQKLDSSLHLHIAYLSGFKIGGARLGKRVGGGGGVYNLICRSLFH
jgi:hypothetical protein